MADRYEGFARSIVGPARSGFAVAPDDATPLAAVSRAIYVGTGGDLVVVLADDADPVTLAAVPSGMLLPVRVRKVLATGTTADGLVALL